MTTLEEIKANEISNELTTRGIENHFSVSHTDYGTSCYFTFYKNIDTNDKYIIRISDHSATNMDRLNNELHVFAKDVNINKIANSIELYLKPENYIFKPTNKNFTHRIKGVLGIYEKI
jgi:hypothetical protein